MHFITYLDEFGHIGPFVSRDHPSHKTSPVFGLGGFVLPSDRIGTERLPSTLDFYVFLAFMRVGTYCVTVHSPRRGE